MEKHFYHLLPSSSYTLKLNFHLKYNAKGEVNHFTQTHEEQKQQVIGKIHLCPVQNMEKKSLRPTISDADTTNK